MNTLDEITKLFLCRKIFRTNGSTWVHAIYHDGQTDRLILVVNKKAPIEDIEDLSDWTIPMGSITSVSVLTADEGCHARVVPIHADRLWPDA